MMQNSLSPYHKRKMGLDSVTAYTPTLMERWMSESSKSIQSTLVREIYTIVQTISESPIKSFSRVDSARGSSTKQVRIKNS